MPRYRRVGFSLIAVSLVWQLLAGCESPRWVFEKSNTSEDLHSVMGMENGEVFAVGKRGTVLVRQNGKWIKLDSGTDNDLYGVWGKSSERIIIVGDQCTALQYSKPIDEQSEQATEQGALFSQVEVASCSNFLDIDGNREHKSIIVGDGKLQYCSGQQCLDGPDFSFRVLGTSSVSAQVGSFVVGDGGNLAIHNGDNWNVQSAEICPVALQSAECPVVTTKPILWDVWVGKHGKGYVLGSAGALWLYPPPAEGFWSPLETNVVGDLKSTYGAVSQQEDESTQGIAVGEDGVILELFDDQVVPISIDSIQDLYDVWMSEDGKDVYAVGAQGTIVHRSL